MLHSGVVIINSESSNACESSQLSPCTPTVHHLLLIYNRKHFICHSFAQLHGSVTWITLERPILGQMVQSGINGAISMSAKVRILPILLCSPHFMIKKLCPHIACWPGHTPICTPTVTDTRTLSELQTLPPLLLMLHKLEQIWRSLLCSHVSGCEFSISQYLYCSPRIQHV